MTSRAERLASRYLRTAAVKVVSIDGEINTAGKDTIRDPFAFLVEGILKKARTCALMINVERKIDKTSTEVVYGGGLDWKIEGDLGGNGGDGAWYWPLDRLTREFTSSQTRYPDLLSALILSFQANDGKTGYVGIRRRGAFQEHAVVGVSLYAEPFDDSDYVKPGTVWAWWLARVKKAKPPSAPVLWRGSDSSLEG